jgi:hypothetical protein
LTGVAETRAETAGLGVALHSPRHT